ncbi:MAG: hypothetical protein K8F59_01740 [Rhodobacteraceae bacterium]|nr:hypothetical protein [Paracoccaceae bacterium]
MKLFSSPFRHLTAIAAAMLTLGIAAEATAAAIDCPLSQVRREITTPLPGGWWNTPIVNNLQSTRVVEIGGRAALQCQYGAAGNIQRYAPDGQTCTATARGFDCAAAASGPRTYSSKILNIPQTYLAELDAGSVSSPGADLWFQAETATLMYLVPQNGAMMGVGDGSNRGFAGCSSARMSRDRVSIRDVPVGTYVCMKTSEGRISQFRVNALSGGSPKTLTIGYTTWQ